MPSVEIILPIFLSAVASYIIGSISFSIIITRIFANTDVRNYGSGNAGTTNVLRTAGKLPALLTLLGDFVKCICAIFISLLIFKLFCGTSYDVTLIKFMSGIFCILGHVYPLFFGFRGGKGVVTVAGIMIMVNWQCFLIAIAIFIIMLVITRIVSISAITASLSLPISVFIFMRITNNRYTIQNTLFALLLTVILIVMHRKNIIRLIKGVEPKLGKKS